MSRADRQSERRADEAEERRPETPARRRRAQGGGGGDAAVVVIEITTTGDGIQLWVQRVAPSNPADPTEYPWILVGSKFRAYPWPHHPIQDFNESVIIDEDKTTLAVGDVIHAARQLDAYWYVYGQGVIPFAPEPEPSEIAMSCA